MSLTIVLLAIAYSHEVTSAQGAASKRELHFSLITAFTGSPTSSGGIPVIDFALEQINNDTRLLPNYNLRYTSILDSKVSHIISHSCIVRFFCCCCCCFLSSFSL